MMKGKDGDRGATEWIQRTLAVFQVGEADVLALELVALVAKITGHAAEGETM